MRLEWMMNRHHQLADGNYLYISAYPQEFELNDIGNIGFQRAVAQPGLIKFHKDLGTWDEVFVIQTLGVQPMDGEIIEPPTGARPRALVRARNHYGSIYDSFTHYSIE